jgi:hypothetical protein
LIRSAPTKGRGPSATSHIEKPSLVFHFAKPFRAHSTYAYACVWPVFWFLFASSSFPTVSSERERNTPCRSPSPSSRTRALMKSNIFVVSRRTSRKWSSRWSCGCVGRMRMLSETESSAFAPYRRARPYRTASTMQSIEC